MRRKKIMAKFIPKKTDHPSMVRTEVSILQKVLFQAITPKNPNLYIANAQLKKLNLSTAIIQRKPSQFTQRSLSQFTQRKLSQFITIIQRKLNQSTQRSLSQLIAIIQRSHNQLTARSQRKLNPYTVNTL
jgi:hypothetical protein